MLIKHKNAIKPTDLEKKEERKIITTCAKNPVKQHLSLIPPAPLQNVNKDNAGDA